MPGIVLILIMVLLVTLWIMGAYVDVKNTHRQNGHNSGSELVKTEIIQKDSQKQKPAFHGENIEKEDLSSQGSEEKARENVSLRGSRTLLSLPTGQAPLQDNPSPDPDPVDIPRERMRFLRTFREEEPVPESEEAHDTLLPDSPENTGNSPAGLDSMSEEDFETALVNPQDESIQAAPSLENQATQTDFNKRDIGVGEPLRTEDAAAQVSPEKQNASTGDPLLKEDAAIQVAPEKQDAQVGDPLQVINESIQVIPENEDQSIQALPSRHDVSLGSHISQYEQGVQHDLSTHSIGLDPSSPPVEEKSIQVLQSLRDVSLQNSLAHESKGVGSHVSYSSKEIEANPEHQDQFVQHSRSFKSIGLDPRSFHMSDYSSVMISEEENQASPKSENILDNIPLSQSVWIEEEHKQPLIKKSPLALDDLSVLESIYPDAEQSLVESILISDHDIENQEEQPSFKSLKSPAKSKKKSQKDSDSFEMISRPKSLHSHSSWDLLEDEEK